MPGSLFPPATGLWVVRRGFGHSIFERCQSTPRRAERPVRPANSSRQGVNCGSTLSGLEVPPTLLARADEVIEWSGARWLGKMDKDYLALKRASTSRPSVEWNDDGFDVLCDGAVVGQIMKAATAPVGMPWMWTLDFGQHEDRTPTHGHAATREAAMATFAKSWRRE